MSTYLGKGLVWEHFDFNEKNQFLKDKTLRTAIFTAINRQDIIARTIGSFVQGAQPLGNHIYVPGQPGYKDNVTSTKQGSGDLATAKQMLTDAGYTGVGSSLKTTSGQHVTFRCTYSAGNTNRQTECQIVQTTLKKLGIDVTLKTTTGPRRARHGQLRHDRLRLGRHAVRGGRRAADLRAQGWRRLRVQQRPAGREADQRSGHVRPTRRRCRT